MFANEEDTKYYDEKFRRYLDELESRMLKNSRRVNKKSKKNAAFKRIALRIHSGEIKNK